jgi:hypothetical protein
MRGLMAQDQASVEASLSVADRSQARSYPSLVRNSKGYCRFRRLQRFQNGYSRPKTCAQKSGSDRHTTHIVETSMQ